MVIDPNEPYVLAAPSVVAGLDCWRELEVKQQPNWPDAAAVAAASAEVSALSAALAPYAHTVPDAVRAAAGRAPRDARAARPDAGAPRRPGLVTRPP